MRVGLEKPSHKEGKPSHKEGKPSHNFGLEKPSHKEGRLLRTSTIHLIINRRYVKTETRH